MKVSRPSRPRPPKDPPSSHSGSCRTQLQMMLWWVFQWHNCLLGTHTPITKSLVHQARLECNHFLGLPWVPLSGANKHWCMSPGEKKSNYIMKRKDSTSVTHQMSAIQQWHVSGFKIKATGTLTQYQKLRGGGCRSDSRASHFTVVECAKPLTLIITIQFNLPD